MNPLRLVWLFFVQNGEEIYGWGRERITHTVRVLTSGVVISAALLVAGIITGKIGEHYNDPSVLNAASMLVAVSGFLAALSFALFWLKTAVLTHLLVAASGTAHEIVGKVPKLEFDRAEAFLKWMRGVTGWLTLVCLYGALVPLWASIYWTLIVGIVFLFLSAAMTAQWTQSENAKKAVIAFAVLMLLVATANLAAPGFARGVRESVASVADSVGAFKSDHVAMAKVERKAATAEREQDSKLVEQLRAVQFQIRARAYSNCGGKFCTPTDETDYRKIDKTIERIKDGTYWSGEQDKERSVSHGTFRRKATGRLPVVPVRPPPRSARANRGGTTRLSKAQADYVWSELDTKYRDLQ